MNMMNGDFRPQREHKPLQELVQQALAAFIEQAADDDEAAATVRRFMRANDLTDHELISEVVSDQLLYRDELPQVLVDIVAPINALLTFVGANCFDELIGGNTFKSQRLCRLIDGAHSATSVLANPYDMPELLIVMGAFNASRSDPSDQA